MLSIVSLLHSQFSDSVTCYLKVLRKTLFCCWFFFLLLLVFISRCCSNADRGFSFSFPATCHIERDVRLETRRREVKRGFRFLYFIIFFLPRWLLGRVEDSRIHRAALLTPRFVCGTSTLRGGRADLSTPPGPDPDPSSRAGVSGATRNPARLPPPFFLFGLFSVLFPASGEEEEARDLVEVSVAG